jgi:hypothetical protein
MRYHYGHRRKGLKPAGLSHENIVTNMPGHIDSSITYRLFLNITETCQSPEKRGLNDR